jgi:hypothetical protein
MTTFSVLSIEQEDMHRPTSIIRTKWAFLLRMVVLPPLLVGVPGVQPSSEFRVWPGQVVNLSKPGIRRNPVFLLLTVCPCRTNSLQPALHFCFHTRSQSCRFHRLQFHWGIEHSRATRGIVRVYEDEILVLRITANNYSHTCNDDSGTWWNTI